MLTLSTRRQHQVAQAEGPGSPQDCPVLQMPTADPGGRVPVLLTLGCESQAPMALSLGLTNLLEHLRGLRTPFTY